MATRWRALLDFGAQITKLNRSTDTAQNNHVSVTTKLYCTFDFVLKPYIGSDSEYF